MIDWQVSSSLLVFKIQVLNSTYQTEEPSASREYLVFGTWSLKFLFHRHGSWRAVLVYRHSPEGAARLSATPPGCHGA